MREQLLPCPPHGVGKVYDVVNPALEERAG